SLDANSLSEALEALEQQAEGGRLVAVMSHLRSLAEAVERVWAVTRGWTGSHGRWLGGDERDRAVAEEVRKACSPYLVVENYSSRPRVAFAKPCPDPALSRVGWGLSAARVLIEARAWAGGVTPFSWR